MNTPLNLLAFDLGASNGRAMLGSFDGERITMSELHRFSNPIIELHGISYWDTLGQYSNLKDSLKKYAKLGIGELACAGIDTWGVDYGLLDKNDTLLGSSRSYRGATAEDVEAVHEIVDARELFGRTGIAPVNFNTVYQLHRRRREGDTALDAASTLLFTPDLMAFFLTGEKLSEYTISTTSALYSGFQRGWDTQTMKKLQIPESIFTPVQKSGELRGRILRSIADETGTNPANFAAVGSHDTASAVAAIPGRGSFAFCSSGTWSLFGIETDSPALSDEAFETGVSNEGTVQGGFRPLRNIMGLWLLQECRREWLSSGQDLSWDDIDMLAAQAEPFRSLVDVDFPEFYAPGNMAEKIRKYCALTAQPQPETVGQICRCIYESLALKYRYTINALEGIRGSSIDSLNIVGGGIHNKPLNRMAATATGKPVITGPVEGAALGNMLMQAVALGELKNLSEAREVVRASVETETYEPGDISPWDDAFARLERYQNTIIE